LKCIGTLLIAGCFACNDFLDVSADHEIIQKELFETGEGIRVAVNGVYKSLSSTDLYAYNLTYGFVSAMANNYLAYSSTYLPYGLYMAANFEYENSSVMEIADNIWTKGFNVIANCNNILQEVESKDSTFFETGDAEKQMIRGEMYGIRAMMHFDLLRLFCPSPASGRQGKMPYVERYPEYQPEHISQNEVMDKIIADMETCRQILGKVDTVFCRSWNTSLTGRLRNPSSWMTTPPNTFVSYRGHRMNYMAATALLARIYLYKGDMEHAFEMASLAYAFTQTPTRWFAWTSTSYQGAISMVDYISPKKPEEIYMAFSNTENYTFWTNLVSSSNYYFRMNNMADLFQGDMDDYRYVGYFNRYDNDNRYVVWQPKTADPLSFGPSQGHLLPVIRLSEIYHILIEYWLSKGNKDEALKYFTPLRTARGAKAAITALSVDELKEKLFIDIIRETLTQGQTFFLFKRLNRNIYDGDGWEIIMQPEDWVVPIPDSETAYQLN
jgi:hypothetical protein